MIRFCSLVALCAMVFVVPGQRTFAEDKPAAAPAPVAGHRTAEQVQEELQKASDALHAILETPDMMIDPAKRAEVAPRALPALKKIIDLFDELGRLDPEQKKELRGPRIEFLMVESVFGNKNAQAELESEAKVEGAPGLEARLSLQLAEYWRNAKDEAVQNKALDEVQKLAQANPTDDSVLKTLMKMANVGPATPKVAERAEKIVVSDLKGERAAMAAVEINGRYKLKESVGKPVELTGQTLDGKTFSTKDWKGKVILVDFWATWCAPCVKALPRVKKMYIDYHAKGLEIVGVTCDSEVERLQVFLDKNKDMPWPQLFDAKESPKLDFSPVAKAWGVERLPTMFLIDRNGVLQSVAAEDDFEKQIPKLIEAK